jgi:uncharacterized cupredoxin-like copper-binding protein
MSKFSKTILVASVLAMSFATYSFAARPVETVKVELAGEADQPMTVNVDKATVKAGTIEFDVSNVAIGTDHEVVVVKLPNKDTQLVVDTKTHRINEKKLKSMGEVAGLRAGQSGKLKVKLAAGEYVLLCNHASHFEMGMATHFTVTN